MQQPIGIFGGTFDPFHRGHLQVAIEAYKQLELQEIHLIPCWQSPFKAAPGATPAQRLEIMHLSCASYPFLKINTQELERQQISYSIDTVRAFRTIYPNTPLVLLMSEDAFASFCTWRNWEEILELAHLGIANRAHSKTFPAEIKNLLAQRKASLATDLTTIAAGKIIFIPIKPEPISATAIRTALRNKTKVTGLAPEALDYIKQHKIYQYAGSQK